MPIKVRTRKAAWSGVARCAFMAGLVMAGCRGNAEAEPDAAEGERSSRFGDPYQLVGNFAPADPDVTPILEGDTLVARLTYPGGCKDHAFDLDYEVEQDTAKLWLYHDGNGDDCEGLLRDELRLPVPDDVADAPTVVLLNPGGGMPHILRWGS